MARHYLSFLLSVTMKKQAAFFLSLMLYTLPRQKKGRNEHELRTHNSCGTYSPVATIATRTPSLIEMNKQNACLGFSRHPSSHKFTPTPRMNIFQVGHFLQTS